MVGSKAWFMYEDDSGLNYAVELDESAGDAPDLGFSLVDISDTVGEGRMLTRTGTRPLAMRYVNCARLLDGATIRQSFPVGSSVAFSDLRSASTITVGGTVWNISSLRGEQVTLVPFTDTGRLDGDIEPIALP